MDNILVGKKIIIVDDEFAQRRLLELILGRAGAAIETSADYDQGMNLLQSSDPDLVLIDIMMPKVDGFTMCHRIRQISNVPIIIVTARDQPEDIVTGLQAGADDYITKPYESKILVERVKAVLRRGFWQAQPRRAGEFSDDYLYIDLQEKTVKVEGEPVDLKTTEFDVLAFLLRHANKSCSVAEIMVHLWGVDCFHHPEYIHAYIWRLRHKLEINPRYPEYIITDNNDGFRFVFSKKP